MRRKQKHILKGKKTELGMYEGSKNTYRKLKKQNPVCVEEAGTHTGNQKKSKLVCTGVEKCIYAGRKISVTLCKEGKIIKDTLYEELIKRKKILEILKQNIERKIFNAPQGNLKIIHCRGDEQYYVVCDETKNIYPNGKYLRKSEMETVRKLAQRSYDEKMLFEVKKQLKNIEDIIQKIERKEIISIDELGAAYNKIGISRKKFIKPWIMSDEDYIRNWMNVQYAGKDFTTGQVEIYTEKGEKVRSKSEKIIADMLYHKGIPYRYEFPIALKEVGNIYPDFTCLRMSDRKEIIWEHFGMMGDSEYSKNALKKITTYTKNGYIQGENIIYTFESAEYGLNTINVEQTIKKILLI